jgi:hypothetical protein
MSDFIEHADVSPVTLSLHLENATVAHTLQEDGDIYVTEPGWFPFWIHILPKPDFIGLLTFINFRKSSTELQRLKIANEFNRENYIGTAFVDDGDVLKMTHMLSYRYGIPTETLIRACRQFSGGMGLSIDQFDPDYQILMRLSETQSVETENE